MCCLVYLNRHILSEILKKEQYWSDKLNSQQLAMTRWQMPDKWPGGMGRLGIDKEKIINETKKIAKWEEI